MHLYKTQIPARSPLTEQTLAILVADFGYDPAAIVIRAVTPCLENDFTSFEGSGCRGAAGGSTPSRIEIAARHASVSPSGGGHEVAVHLHEVGGAVENPEFPAGYRCDNVLGALIAALHDRFDGYYTVPQVARAVADRFGDGDYGSAEDVLWTEIGPVLDSIEHGVRDQIQTVALPAPGREV